MARAMIDANSGLQRPIAHRVYHNVSFCRDCFPDITNRTISMADGARGMLVEVRGGEWLVDWGKVEESRARHAVYHSYMINLQVVSA